MSDSFKGRQLALPVGLDVEATFDNYYLPEDSVNFQVLYGLYSLVHKPEDTAVLLWGEKRVGLTHLLRACVSQAEQLKQSSCYISLTETHKHSAEQFPALVEQKDLVCIDDIDAIAGDSEWELALFAAYNQLKDAGKRIVFASHQSPKNLSFLLPDLRSRVLSGPVFQLQALNDDDKIGALQLQAHRLGMNMPLDVAQYIVNHTERNLGYLFKLLEHLDRETLVQQRRLTIPFVKQVLKAQ